MIPVALRLAIRSAWSSPGLAGAAILTLALGIGANTAIFSLWQTVAHAALPGVATPNTLTILTDPDASGLWRGSWTTTLDGPRPWVSYAEFETLRDQVPAFASLMAAQSSLNEWQVRIAEERAAESVQGRLVSGDFFQVLGVGPAAGRLFTRAEDSGEPAVAVISHAFWQRRLAGRADAIGTAIHFRGLSVVVVGIAPRGFIGETAGQHPDIWLPLRLQPRILPGDNWLVEQAPDKVMWLHVFGRLRPGTTATQAETQANAVLRANLEAFYGGAVGDRRDELLDQRLRVAPGGRGVSATISQFSSSVAVLFAAVGILLAIACANLASLLLARGVARGPEMAVRMSFGATRARLIRLMLAESLTLSAVSGAWATVLAYGLHRSLVTMLRQADARFAVDFSFDLPMVSFTAAITVLAGLAIGVLPAVQMSRTDGAPPLRDHGRIVGAARELRSGQWLVATQLACALPLLLAAGLLVRTLYNLQHPDLGFRPDGVVIVQVSLAEISPQAERRNQLMRDLQARLAAIPGIEAATFSQLGLFGGGLSTALIAVDGSEPRESALDRVGAGYFTTLRIPVRGRDIAIADGADTARVAVVNDAFVRQFLLGRNPIGIRIRTTDDTSASPYEIVGVVPDMRMQSLRGDVQPRFFVPAEQRASAANSRSFILRTGGDAAAVMAAAREAVRQVDPALTVVEVGSLAERLAVWTAEDRAIARLSIVFGLVALTLAALGLYGVLSYGVTRRSSEIAIRMALGAQPGGIVATILRETLTVVAGGLIAGGVLAYGSASIVAARLYGVEVYDPAIIIGAVASLLMVAGAAAYLPARRASHMDPITTLRRS